MNDPKKKPAKPPHFFKRLATEPHAVNMTLLSISLLYLFTFVIFLLYITLPKPPGVWRFLACLYTSALLLKGLHLAYRCVHFRCQTKGGHVCEHHLHHH